MKLLFDQNLSFKLCKALADLFPNSSQIRLLGLEGADDLGIWEYAKANGFTLVSQDADFAEMASILGPTPKVIWLRCGNQPTFAIANILRVHAEAIAIFAEVEDAAFLEVY
jgi:predicted nuclease of predicted toxin-antitoxin system